ncbi:hypothetical protein PPL_10512 [Heterostelium album PN500]|uniref:Iron-binding zinc finger CDGSH type domain-containing protein n=1 Tax=Heterostelium pallidum (strain ATCC 26659 / Pp 5 / PN500) TaxID=670386 RepID=D3BRA6_HETP5|nr:hypothetical protein PPL_10512 [Heterostelium album PN500]EFA75938.1 hypothetical protein PPL_10512 [Heterostelium album PN500]|eukprot:XP_020428072.1 hypothetical protein PPL_10512 [Heterostelium album PN500]
MSESQVPAKQWDIAPENFSLQGPIKVDVSEGDKWICRCGHSKNYPYCDSSHKEYNQQHFTSFSPLKVAQEQDKVVWVCRCGHSKDAPFCDGTHNTLRKIKEKEANQIQSYLIWGGLTTVLACVFVGAANYLSK